jgi:hypothetical protein
VFAFILNSILDASTIPGRGKPLHPIPIWENYEIPPGIKAAPRLPACTISGGAILMADNVVQTLQHLLQDVIAPDVRELKIRVTSLEKQIDVRFEPMD